jgi:hypothetical protein
MYLGVHGGLAGTVPLTASGPTFLGQIAPTKFFAAYRAAVEAVPAGLVPLVTFKPRPTDVAAGLWDAPLTAAKGWTTRPVLAYPWHEPENDLRPAVFTAMFDRVYDRLASINVRVGYTAMAYQWRPGSATTGKPAAWRPTRCDWLGCDVYSGDSVPASTELAEHPGFQRWWRLLAGGGPFLLPERGWKGPNSVRAATIAADAQWLSGRPFQRRCDLLNAWNTAGTENDTGWLLTGTAATAVRSALQLLAGHPHGAAPA